MMRLPLAVCGKQCFAGRYHPQLPCPTVEPMVLARDGKRSIVFAAGELKDKHMFRMASLVAAEKQRTRPDGRQLVYLLPSMLSGTLGSLRLTTSLLQAGHDGAVIAFLDGFCYGPALWLAYHCDLLFATPTVSIGWFGCRTVSDGRLDNLCTAAMIDDLCAMNPGVSRATFVRLVESSVTGEQAEALGLLRNSGTLPRDIFDFTGIDGSKWPVGGPPR